MHRKSCQGRPKLGQKTSPASVAKSITTGFWTGNRHNDLHMTSTMNREMHFNLEHVPVVTAYDYGYESCAPSPSPPRRATSIVTPPSSMGVFADDNPFCPSSSQGLLYEDPADLYTSMPPDRLARKQRPFCRRGGAGHSELLKSAVMAAMETQDDDSDDGNSMRTGQQGRRGTLVSLQDSLASSHDGAGSARKRARLFSRGVTATPSGLSCSSGEFADEVANASDLFESMCCVIHVEESKEEVKEAVAKEFVRKAPIRRVSRRTSYDSRISDQSDGDSDFN
jgi:hypothetical protein